MGTYLQLLGPVEATVDGRSVPLGATKQRALLAMLALEANATVPVDRLVDGLWGEDPPPSAAKMVQLYVSQLRRLLIGDDVQIVTRGRGYELCLDGDAVDAVRFERLVERAGKEGDGDGDAAARTALALWHGAALSDVATEPFASAEIRRLDELRLIAAERAIDGDLAAGRDHEALAALERLIAEHPLRERLHARRMLALYRSGRQVEALDAYRAARHRLVEEAGVEPGAELRELHDRVLRQDPALSRSRAAAPTAAAPIAAAADRPAAAEVPANPPRRFPSLGWSALVAAALAACLLAISRLTGDDHLASIDEDAVGVIDPAEGAIVTQYRHVGADPQMVVGGAGSVWIAHPATATVSRIRGGGRRLDTIDVGGRPSALAYGGGSVWVADEDHGDVAQIDPMAGRVIQRIRVGNGLRALAVGHGALWAATALDGEVVRVDLRTGKIAHRFPVGGQPVALAVSHDAVWAAAEESGQVLRIDPDVGVVHAIRVGDGPAAIAVGEGAVWVANRQDGTVSRIDPATNRVSALVAAGREPAAMTVAGGAVWVGDAAGGVRALSPRTARIVATVATGSVPAGLATVDGTVWVTGAAPPSAHRGGTLRVGRFPFSLDPGVSGYDPSAMAVLELAYDGLVRHRRAAGAAGARVVPGLATDVPAPTAGGRRYVFRLREGGRYADGTPVRARDVRASLERMLEIQGEEQQPIFDAIVGATRCRTRPGACDLSRGVLADERHATVTFRLRRPDPELIQKLTLSLAMVVPAATPRHATARPIPGTGPYRVARVVAGHRALLTRNPRFRSARDGGRTAGFVDRVEVLMAADPHAGLLAFDRGRLDVAGTVDLPVRQLAALRTRYGGRLRSGAYAKTVYVWMNVHAPPFDDVRVRRALNLAIDRNRAVDALGGPDNATAACQMLPPGIAGYRPYCPFTAGSSPGGAWLAPDRNKAKALVGASRRRGEDVVVWTPKLWAALGDRVVVVLRDLGFRARVRIFAGFGDMTLAAHDRREHPQVGFGGWIADYPEPAGFLRALLGCASDARAVAGANGLSRFCDHGLDAAIDRAQAAGPEAGDAWRRIEARIARQAPVAPLMNGRFTVVTTARTGNLQFHPLSGLLLDATWVR